MEPNFQPEKYTWLKSIVRLDLMALDEEIMEIPVLIQECGEYAAQAIDAVNICKDGYNAVRATVADLLRRDILPNGKTRSEAQIESEIDRIDKLQEAADLLSAAKLDAGLWQALFEGLQTKNFSIRTAADLITKGFITQDHIISKRREELRKGE